MNSNEQTPEENNSPASLKLDLRTLVNADEALLQRLRGRAQFFLDGGHHERALIMLDMLDSLEPGNIDVDLWTIDVLLKLGRSDAADEKLQSLLAAQPDNPDLRVSQAELWLQTGEPGRAAALLRELVSNLDADGQHESLACRRARRVYARGQALLSN